MNIICADCGRAIDSPAHLCVPLITDPMARYDGHAGDLVPGWCDTPEYAADARDQRKQDMR